MRTLFEGVTHHRDLEKERVVAYPLSQDMAVKVLDESVGKIVLIKLKGGKTIRGSLQGFDQHMNLLVEQSEEILEEGKTNPLGTIVVRGDNVVIISPPRNSG